MFALGGRGLSEVAGTSRVGVSGVILFEPYVSVTRFSWRIGVSLNA